MEAVVWHGEGWAAPCDIAQDTHMKMTTTTQSIPARSSPGTRTAPSVAGNQDRSMRLMDQSPNVRSLRAAGEVEELTHEMKEYQWNILGLCEVRWKKTLVKHLLQRATSSFSVAVKTDMSMELDSSFTKTL